MVVIQENVLVPRKSTLKWAWVKKQDIPMVQKIRYIFVCVCLCVYICVCVPTQTHVPQGSRVRKTSWEKEYLFSVTRRNAHELAREGSGGRLFQVALFLGRDSS